MPLSYAAILGGTCTLIGTSTNLVVAGMAQDHGGLEFGMFEIATLGLPAAILGNIFIILASRWLLPDRGTGRRSLENAREYTVLMRVRDDSPVVGRTIEEADLRRLPGLFLVEIEREREIMPAVGPSTRLHANDRLLFAGVVDGMVDLRKIRGLVPDTDQIDKLEGRPERRLVEAVVGAQSTLAGKSVRETEFRTVYNAAIIAVHRRGQRIRSKVGDIVLQPGDVLLLETQPTFATLHQHDPNFALLSEVRGSKPPKHDKAWIATLILLAMVTTNAAGLIPLSVAALLASGAMLLTRCLTGEEARRALELRVLLTIGAALGLGTALEQTGAASVVGDAIVSLSARFGPVAVLIGIYGATAVLAGIITTAAAAAIMFPVAAAAASAVAVDLKPVSYIVMIAASMAFSTPIGYQTNLMVYGPGGYRFADFLRLGLPLQIMLGVVVIALASWLWM